jgi:hypothetical protein
MVDIAGQSSGAQQLPNVQLGEATTVCAKAILISGRNTLAGDAGKALGLPVGDVIRVVQIGGDSVQIVQQLPNGTTVNTVFDFARLITRLGSAIPGSRLFGTIGTPALYCLQAQTSGIG